MLTGGLAVVVCAVVGGASLAGYLGARAGLVPLTARAIGEVAAPAPGGVLVRWTPQGGEQRTDPVALAVTVPPEGTHVEVAYDPGAPDRFVVPGAQVLADLDAETGGLAFSVAAAAVLLGSALWQLGTRVAALRRGRTGTVPGRRVRVQRGTVARSWLELDSGHWLPVHFEPALVALPAPTAIELHGDPAHAAYVAATVAGPDGPVRLAPSGRVRRREPLGRRTDNPSAPDDETLAGLHRFGWLRQLRADLGAVVVAPLLGLLWVLVVGGGVLTWLAASALAAAGGLHVAALRGSDPS